MPMSTCRGCDKIFSSNTLFDDHRIGNFEEPIYQARETGHTLKVVGYTPHTRRCMTTEELLAKGCIFERKSIRVFKDGKRFHEERNIWFDPKAREAARNAFTKVDEHDEEEEESDCPA